MQRKTNELNKISQKVGLRIHAGKTKVLKTEDTINGPITLENTPLEYVESFTYLGSIIDRQGGTDADVVARIAKARTALVQFNKVWKASKISRKTKLRLFNSNVKSVLLYECETWKTTMGVIMRVQTFINRCLRRIMKIGWEDRVKNEDLWERTGHSPVEIEIGRRRWRWIGHTLRKPRKNIARHALQLNPQGKRGRGRPRETWRRCVERETKDALGQY